jgi:hypothetical protein
MPSRKLVKLLKQKETKGNMSRRKAIRLKCLDCSGYECSEVAHCQITNCPLYPLRSRVGKQNPKGRERAIKAYCLFCMNDQPREIALCISPFCSLFPYRGYNRAKKGSVAKKTSHRGINKHDLPEMIQEHHYWRKIAKEVVCLPHFNPLIDPDFE